MTRLTNTTILMKAPAFFLPVLGILLLGACTTDTDATRTAIEAEPAPLPGIELAYMDTTVSPSADFYRFVNGAWLDKTEIPADRGSWGSFNALRKDTDTKTLAVLTGAAEGDEYAPDSDQGKAVTFYNTAMDTTALNELGVKPIQAELARIDAIQTKEDLQAYLTSSAQDQHNSFFGFQVTADLNNSERNAAYIGTGALGLPERDYYTNTDAESKKIQEQYREHMTRMLGFLGYEAVTAKATADKVYALEKKMAQARLTKEESRNPLVGNNPRAIAQLQALAPAINWKAYLDGIGLGKLDTIIVSDLGYMTQLNTILKNTDLKTLKEYVKWTEFNQAADYLSTDIEQANFDFFGKILNGTQEQRPRDERVLGTANWIIGEAIGKLYVDAYFPPAAKKTAEEMVENIKIAFGERIKRLEWMSDETKEKALNKLSTFTVKIAYPDKWKSYKDLTVQSAEEGGSYLGNMMHATHRLWKEDLDKVGKKVDKSEWFMSPQIVNAYYNPLFNEIVFPAAILQPPFYNYQADPAVNYGGVGAVIGHEISHGFDDQGSRFDADGNLKNWWTDADRERFDARAQKLVKQFDAFSPLEGVNVNGTFTLGENIGDLGGINVAYDALQRHLQEHGDPGLIDGFTQNQRFFISWATIWRGKARDEALKSQIKTDPHSPGMYRAIGPIANVDAFYQAFKVTPNDPVYIPDSSRVKIW